MVKKVPFRKVICINLIDLSSLYAFKHIYNFSLVFRVGQRGAGLSATIARSEHEISEIIDGLSEQEVRK